MRQGSNGRRPRGRANRKQHVPLRAQVFDSNGPEGRVRGNAHQVYERYLALARDATSSGDRIQAESFYQFAEHYLRILNAASAPSGGPPSPNGGQGSRPLDPGSAEQPALASDGPAHQDAIDSSRSGAPDRDARPGGESLGEAKELPPAGGREDSSSAAAEPQPGNGGPAAERADANASSSPLRGRRHGLRTRRPRGNGSEGDSANASDETRTGPAAEPDAGDAEDDTSLPA
jgi:hypothetical protein